MDIHEQIFWKIGSDGSYLLVREELSPSDLILAVSSIGLDPTVEQIIACVVQNSFLFKGFDLCIAEELLDIVEKMRRIIATGIVGIIIASFYILLSQQLLLNFEFYFNSFNRGIRHFILMQNFTSST